MRAGPRAVVGCEWLAPSPDIDMLHRHVSRPLGFVASALSAIALLGCSCGHESEGLMTDPAELAVSTRLSQPPMLMIIGIDGADLRDVKRLAREGRLPNLARLMSAGTVAELATVANASPIIWTTVATGVMPEKHGIEFFRDPDNTPAASYMRKRPAFWNILSHYGRSVGVLSWWASFPAEEVNGYVVSPFCVLMPPIGTESRVGGLWGRGGPRKVYPTRLQEQLTDLLLFEEDMTPKIMGRLYAGKKKTTNTPWVIAKDRTYYDMALRLLENEPVEVVAVYYQGVDAAGHDFDRYVYGSNRNEVRDPNVSAEELAAAQERVWAMYEYADQMVGGLTAGLGADTNVIVLSDHGWNYDGTSHWNDDPGIFIASGPCFEARDGFEGLSVVDVAPVILTIMGVPLSRDFDGELPEGLLRDECAAGVSWVDEYPFPAVALSADAASGGPGGDGMTPEEEEMNRRLRGLGYIGDDPDKDQQ